MDWLCAMNGINDYNFLPEIFLMAMLMNESLTLH